MTTTREPHPDGPQTGRGELPSRSRMSAIMLGFAEPLITAMGPEGPPNIGALRSAIKLATLAWNVPLLARFSAPGHAEATQAFEDAVKAMPALASRILRQLVADRETKLSNVQFFVETKVEGTSLDDARVVARAMRAPQAE